MCLKAQDTPKDTPVPSLPITYRCRFNVEGDREMTISAPAIENSDDNIVAFEIRRELHTPSWLSNGAPGNASLLVHIDRDRRETRIAISEASTPKVGQDYSRASILTLSNEEAVAVRDTLVNHLPWTAP
jgi:hypothetical protein